MKFADVLGAVEAAAERTREKREAYERAAAEHQATTDDAKARLLKGIDAANVERDRCVQAAQAIYDAAVGATEAARAQAIGELDSARAELESARAHANSVLGDLLGEQNPRVKISQ